MTRQGDRSGTATVSYATADGSAKAGQDYAAKTGTVTFGPGEATKQITIAVSADTANEKDETFSVALSDAAGAELDAPRTETVTIQDRTPAKKGKLKVRVFRLLSPGLRFAIASDADGSYRYKLTVEQGQADADRRPRRRRRHERARARASARPSDAMLM